MSQLHSVGTFAQILELRDNETFIELVLNAHRRIRLLEPIFDTNEMNAPTIKVNGRRAAAQQRRSEDGKRREKKSVGPAADQDSVEGTATERKIIFGKTENVIVEPIERDEQTKAAMQAIVQSIREIIGLSNLFEQQLHLILHPSHRVAENPVYLCDLVATIVHSAETADLQQMMQETSVSVMLKRFLRASMHEWHFS